MSHEQAQRLLHDAAEHVDVDAPPTADLIRAGRRARRTRRAVTLVGTTAATVLVIGIGAALVDQAHLRDPVAEPAPSADAVPDGLDTPPGTRLVGANGWAVAVPESWGTNDVVCGATPVSDTVVFGRPNLNLCAASNERFSALHIQPIGSATQSWTRRAEPWRTVGKSEMRRAPTMARVCAAPNVLCPVSTGAVVIEEADLVMWVESPDSATIDLVLDSIRPIPAGYTAVPDLVGEGLVDAMGRLDEADLELSTPRSEQACGFEPCTWRVRDASLIAGTLVPAGTVVALLGPNAIEGDLGSRIRLLDNRRALLTRPGVGGCPWEVTSVSAPRINHVEATFDTKGRACLRKWMPLRRQFQLPAGLDTAVPITFIVSYVGYGPTEQDEVTLLP